MNYSELRDKSLAQFIQALRAGQKVGFNRLPCMRQGFIPAGVGVQSMINKWQSQRIEFEKIHSAGAVQG